MTAPSLPPTPSRWCFAATVRGARWLLGRPALWPAASVPALVLLLLVTVSTWGVLGWLRPSLSTALGAGAAGVGGWLSTLASWALTAVALAVAWMTAYVMTPPLSAPALEHLVAVKERELGAPPRAPLGWPAEVWCGLRAQAAAIAVGAPLVAALSLLGWLLPVLAPLVWAAKALVTSLILAWNLLDYPLTLRGTGIRERLSFLGRHRRPVVWFGLGAGLTFLVPCAGVLFLPAAVVGATDVLWRLHGLPAEPDAGAPVA